MKNYQNPYRDYSIRKKVDGCMTFKSSHISKMKGKKYLSCEKYLIFRKVQPMLK